MTDAIVPPEVYVLAFVSAETCGTPTGPLNGLPTIVVPEVPATATYVRLKLPGPVLLTPETVNSEPGI
jgi:hypothetical protein